MALLTYADRVAETTTTTGTGTIQLGGAVDGKFRTFVAGAGSGNTVPYVMVHRTANEWEVGYGVVTSGSPDTLTRAGVYSSSNGGSAVTFSAGTKDVFLGLPAGKTVTFDDTTGAVTLSSLTVSGDLTVDTSTLKVDSANNRVGIGTTSPVYTLDVQGGRALHTDNSDVYAIGVRNRASLAPNGNYWIGATNAVSPDMVFSNNAGTERMRLTDSGNLAVDTNTLFVDAANNRVGIGTATPDVTLDVEAAVGTSTSLAMLKNTSAANANNIAQMQFWVGNSFGGLEQIASIHGINPNAGANNGGTLVFSTSSNGTATTPTERMRLDASGNLGVGVTSPTTPIDVRSGSVDGVSLRIRENASGSALIQITDNPVTTARVALAWSNSTTSANLSTTGLLTFSTNSAERARITAGGYFKASNDGTYADATASYHEMRNTSSGNPITDFRHAHASNPYGPRIVFSAGAPDNNVNYFLSCNDTVTTRLLIYSDGDVANHDGVYGTISDAKLKQDITDANSQWDDLKAIRFRKYRFTSDVEQKGEDAPYLLGVVAQELRETSPGLVEAHPDTEQVEVEVEVEKIRPVMQEVEEVVTDAEGVESVVTKSVPMLDEDGQPVTETYTETETRTETRPTGTETLSVKQSILLMKAAVALQEAMARIETLEARLAALEAK